MAVADPNAPIRVLLVDDDGDFLDLAATLLERESDAIETITETDPRAAIDRLEEAAVDCVVSDYRMPELDGLELLGRVVPHHSPSHTHTFNKCVMMGGTDAQSATLYQGTRVEPSRSTDG